MGGWRDEGRAEQKCEADKDKRNTGRGKAMGRERERDSEKREKKEYGYRENALKYYHKIIKYILKSM